MATQLSRDPNLWCCTQDDRAAMLAADERKWAVIEAARAIVNDDDVELPYELADRLLKALDAL